MLHLTKQSISLEAPKYLSNPKDLGHESDDLLVDTISKSSIMEDEATPQKAVDHGLFHDDLKNIMKILDDDEHKVICARYGLHDGLTRTVTTVSCVTQITSTLVRKEIEGTSRCVGVLIKPGKKQNSALLIRPGIAAIKKKHVIYIHY